MFHISIDKLTNLSFIPRVPQNPLTWHSVEDNITPRICVAPTIDNALMGIFYTFEQPTQVFVYAPTGKKTFKVCYPTKEHVPDVHLTNEIWIMEPVQMIYVGSIQVVDKKLPAIEWDYELDIYDHKNTLIEQKRITEQSYQWDWKWIDRRLTW